LQNAPPSKRTQEEPNNNKEDERERPDWASKIIDGFEARVGRLENKVQKITAETNKAAIKFAGLGFRSSKERAGGWLEAEIPHHNCGLIMDAHVALEYVNTVIEGHKTITCLEKLSRQLKTKTIADGLAMTSFESKVPMYLSAPRGHKIIKSEASYFNTLTNYEDWDVSSTGFWDQLKEELIEFKAAHAEHIGDCLDPESQAYAVAMLAPTDAVAWIKGFIGSCRITIRNSPGQSLEARKLGMLPPESGAQCLPKLWCKEKGSRGCSKHVRMHRSPKR
jgi:hypothetical protein